MKKSAYICNAENLQREAIHTPSTTNCVPSSSTSASRSCGFSAKNIRRVRSLFVHNAKLVTTMLKTNKQATTAKNSNRSAQIFKGQAIYFGWLKITKTFTTKADALAWYDRYQQGWRYNNAVAVIWQGCSPNTPTKWLKDALLGGEEWKLATCHAIRSQADCEYILYSDDYVKICEYECAR